MIPDWETVFNKQIPHIRDMDGFNTPTGDVKIEVIFNDEIFWLTQKRMADLFGVEVPAIHTLYSRQQ